MKDIWSDGFLQGNIFDIYCETVKPQLSSYYLNYFFFISSLDGVCIGSVIPSKHGWNCIKIA